MIAALEGLILRRPSVSLGMMFGTALPPWVVSAESWAKAITAGLALLIGLCALFLHLRAIFRRRSDRTDPPEPM